MKHTTDIPPVGVPYDSLELFEHVAAETLPVLTGETLIGEPPPETGPTNPQEGGSNQNTTPDERFSHTGTSTQFRKPTGSPEYFKLFSKFLENVRFEGVWGTQSDIKGTLRFPQKLSMGVRTGIERPVVYVCTENLGPVEALAGGNLRVLFGEGLALGRRDPDAPPACYGNRLGEFRVSPSLSRWKQTDAAAIRIQTGRVRAGALVWSRPEAETKCRQDEGWLTVSLTGERLWIGAAAGVHLPGLREDVVSSPPPGAVTVAVRAKERGNSGDVKNSARIGFSCEFALLGKEPFFSLGTSSRGRSNVWLRYFRQPAPRGFGGSVNGLLDVSKVLQGGSVYWGRRFGRIKAAATLYNSSLGSDTKRTQYRRWSLFLSGRRRRNFAWALSLFFIERRKTEFGTGSLETRAQEIRWNEGRFRTRWDFFPNEVFSFSPRLDLRLDGDGRLEGIQITSGARLAFWRVDIVWRVSNFSLANGRSGFISRPGVGPFEYLTAVYRDGSDVSLRMRFKAFSACEILGYYGKPWEKEKRLYIGTRWVR